MPVIHERAEDSGLYIKSLIQGSGWVTRQISDYGAEILRKFRLARNGKAITKSTLLKMIACKLVYTNTSGTSQSIDLDNEINPNLKMSDEEKKFFEYIKSNEKQIQKSVKLKLAKPQKENKTLTQNKNLSINNHITFISATHSHQADKSNNQEENELKKWLSQPEGSEAFLRYFVFNNLPKHVKSYRNVINFNKCRFLTATWYCPFCKKNIDSRNDI